MGLSFAGFGSRGFFGGFNEDTGGIGEFSALGGGLTEPPFFLPLGINQEGARGRAALSHKPIYWLSSSSKKPSVRPQLLALAELSSSSFIFFFLNTTPSDGFFPPPRHYNRKRNKKNKIDITLQSNYKAQSHRQARGSPVFWHQEKMDFYS